MKDFDVKASLREALRGVEELQLPAVYADDWEAMECLGHSERCDTMLLRNRKNGEKAVLKLLQEEPSVLTLFDKLRRLRHPGLPEVMKVSTEDGRLCVLMAYIEGETLAETDGTFSPDETARVAAQLCDILEVLHGLNPPLIHRDVKPENVLLRPDGTVTLIDFGIARLYNDREEKDTQVMGTEYFAPPEQYGFYQTDARSDLYSLGMLMGWMLTGSVRHADHAAIADDRLRAIVARCTAFSPEDRYASAAEVKKVLMRKPKRKWPGIIAALCCALLAGGLCAWLLQPKPVLFTEPLIEQAARMSLGVSDQATLTVKQLAAVEGLYIFANTVCGDPNGFYDAADAYYAGGFKVRGPVADLSDLRLMPNLRRVMIAANRITDLSPLEGLTEMQKVEFKHNSISDVSPLRNLERLEEVGLNDNPVTDLTALQALPRLRIVDLCDADAYDPTVFEGLGDLDFLDIANDTESWRCLGTRGIRELRISYTDLDSISYLSGVTGLERLQIDHSRVTSLEGIEAHADLKYLNIFGCEVEDLTPLLSLPGLETLVIDARLRPAAEALGETRFGIRYE